MTLTPRLTAEQIQEIGEALYGRVWQSDMAHALGVPRQSIVYYLKSGGANRTQASAIIGLIARSAIGELKDQEARQEKSEARHRALVSLLARMEADGERRN